MPFQSINVMPVLPKPHNGLPRGPQLSAPEDKEMKKKLRNRESALAARERKKKKMLELENRVAELGKENDDLRSENSSVRDTLISVMQKYGAADDEIKEVLRIADAKRTIKKEPGIVDGGEMAKKPKTETGTKRTLLSRHHHHHHHQTQATKVTIGPEKKCRKIIKQEHTTTTNTPSPDRSGDRSPLIKLPKVVNTATTQVATSFFVQKNIQVQQTVKQEPIEPTRRRTSWESVDEQNQSSRYSPPWTPPDMSAMQNSPSSDSAYSTGSETGGNGGSFNNSTVQFIPINTLQQSGFNQQQETVTLYDTEITYEGTRLPRTTTTPSTRVPRYHSYHELMEPAQDQQSEWINLLQSSDIDKLKPEDFLAEPVAESESQNHEIKVEESMDMSGTSRRSGVNGSETAETINQADSADDDKLFNDRQTQSFFQSQQIQLNLDEVFGNEVFGPF